MGIKSALVLAILLLSLASSAAAQPETPKIGVILPLSGPIAAWGKSIQLGIEFANKNSPNKAEYIYEDEAACDSKRALSAAQKLINIDKVSLIMTACFNGTRAILPVTKKSGILIVSLGLVDDDLISKNQDFLLTPSANIAAETDGLSKLLKSDGKRKLSVIRVEDSYTDEIMRGLRKYSARDGWEIVADERLSFESSDFRSTLLGISRNGSDSVLIYMSTQQVINAVKQLRQLKLDSLSVYGGYVIEADPPPMQDLPVLNGVRYTAVVTPINDDLTRFLAAKNSRETFQTRVAADAVGDISRSFTNCPKNQDSKCIWREVTKRTEASPAFSGSFFYDQNGLATRTIRPKIVKDGKYQWLDR